MAADESGAIAGMRCLSPAQVHESRALAEFRTPGIACEQRAGCLVQRGHDERRRLRAVRAQRPLHEGGDRQPALAPGTVAQAQARDLDAVGDRHVLQQFQFDAVRPVLEAAVALPVSHHVFAGIVAARGGGPHPAIFLVADIQQFLRRIADRIVGPRRQRIALAVQRPGVATAGFGRGETELRIGDHVEPGHRWQATVADDRDELAAIVVETAIAIEEFKAGFDGGEFLEIDWLPRPAAQLATCRRGEGAVQCRQRIDLRGQCAVLLVEHDPRGGRQARLQFRRSLVAAQGEHVGLGIGLRMFFEVIGDAFLQGVVQRGCRVRLRRIEQDEIGIEALSLPERMRAQEFVDQRQARFVMDAQQHDRIVAGNSTGPQRGWSALPLFDRVGRGSQRGIAVQQRRGQPLETPRLSGIDPGVVERLLRLSCCAFPHLRAVRCRPVTLHQCQHFVARGRCDRPQLQVHRFAGRDLHAPAQAEDRIEHGADTAAQRRIRLQVQQASAGCDHDR